MTAIRTPRSVAAATTLAERFAAIEGELVQVEAARNEAIAEANAEADKLAEPMIAERDAIREKLAAWWPTVSGALTQGKRKIVELGGCMIGSKLGKASLVVAADEMVVVAALQRRKWAGPLLRTRVSLDKNAILMSLDGVYKRDLRHLGFSRSEPGEEFVLKRTEQGGTLGGAG